VSECASESIEPAVERLSSLSKNVAQLRAKAEKLAADADAARLEAEAQIQEANALQTRLAYLNKDVDDCADALVTGDVQAERFRVAIITLENALINSWGRRNGYSEELPVPSYSELVSMKAAAADWSRIRPVLKERLAKAQAAMSAFEKTLS